MIMCDRDIRINWKTNVW